MGGGGIVESEFSWSRIFPPINGAKSSNPHLGWVGWEAYPGNLEGGENFFQLVLALAQ